MSVHLHSPRGQKPREKLTDHKTLMGPSVHWVAAHVVVIVTVIEAVCCQVATMKVPHNNAHTIFILVRAPTEWMVSIYINNNQQTCVV